MNSRLNVTVAVDVGSGSITVTPEGRLTLRNVQGLLPVTSRAASVAPDFHLILDLTRLADAEPRALEVLRGAQPQDTRVLPADGPEGRHRKSALDRRDRRATTPHGAAA